MRPIKNKLSHFFDHRKLCLVLKEIRLRHRKGYDSLLQHIVGQIRAYFVSNEKPKLIIGISGGIDSTVTAYLATLAVGSDNVVLVNLPMEKNEESTYRAELVARNLKIEKFFKVYIGNLINEEIKILNSLKSQNLRINVNEEKRTLIEKIRIGNLASRLRVAFLYDFSKSFKGRVLGSGNKIELFQGFLAKYGTPFSYDYGILDELYKVDVYELAEILGVPKLIIDSVPTTGYYKGQTHEKELGATLEEQDAIIYLLFEKKYSPEIISTEYCVRKEFIELTLNRYKNSLHKLKLILKQPHVKIK